eukprot:gene22226-17851_t
MKSIAAFVVVASACGFTQAVTMKHKTTNKKFLRKGTKGGAFKYEMRGITGRAVIRPPAIQTDELASATLWVGPSDIFVDLSLYDGSPTFRYDYFALVSNSDSRMGARGTYAEAVERCAEVGGEVAAFEDQKHGYWVGATTSNVRADEPVWYKENGNKWTDSLLKADYNQKNSNWKCVSGGTNNGNPYIFQTSSCSLKKRMLCQRGGDLITSSTTMNPEETSTTDAIVTTTSTTGMLTTSTTEGPETTTSTTSTSSRPTHTTGPTVDMTDCGMEWVQTGNKPWKGHYTKVDDYNGLMKYTARGSTHPKHLGPGTMVKATNLGRCRMLCDQTWDENDANAGCKAFTF